MKNRETQKGRGKGRNRAPSPLGSRALAPRLSQKAEAKEDRRASADCKEAELMFQLYQEQGGYGQVESLLRQAGVLNPRSGKSYVKSSIRLLVHSAPGYEAYAEDQVREQARIQARLLDDLSQLAGRTKT